MKREIKLSPITRNRSRSNATIGNDKNSPESSSPSMMTATNSENGGNSNMNIVHSRKNTPNKWDAVMNKIALNKAEVKTKKNYNEVKSKVTCGLKRNSPNQIKTPASEPSTTNSDSGISSLTITATKLDTNKSPITPLARQTTFGITKRLVIYLSSQLQYKNTSTISPVHNNVNNLFFSFFRNFVWKIFISFFLWHFSDFICHSFARQRFFFHTIYFILFSFCFLLLL